MPPQGPAGAAGAGRGQRGRSGGRAGAGRGRQGALRRLAARGGRAHLPRAGPSAAAARGAARSRSAQRSAPLSAAPPPPGRSTATRPGQRPLPRGGGKPRSAQTVPPPQRRRRPQLPLASRRGHARSPPASDGVVPAWRPRAEPQGGKPCRAALLAGIVGFFLIFPRKKEKSSAVTSILSVPPLPCAGRD